MLFITNELIEFIGKSSGVGLGDFINSVKEGPSWATRSGFCQKAIQASEDWRTRGFDYPPYINYLSFFVLAGGAETDFSPASYYPGFWKLLGEPQDSGTPPSFDRMIELWDDLEKWSREDRHEELGRFVARIRGGYWKVGLARAQTVLSEQERKYLPTLFSQASLDPTDPPAPSVMKRLLQRHGVQVLEKRTLRLLAASADEQHLSESLIEVVLDELEEWDGTIEVPLTEDNAVTRGTKAGLRICLILDGVARRVKSHVRFKTSRIFPEDGLNFQRKNDTHVWSCSETYQGWSTPLKDLLSSSRVILDASALDWVNGEQFYDDENHWNARLRGAGTRVFLSGDQEKFSEWIEFQKIERGVQFILACYGKDIEKVQQWGQKSCSKFTELLFMGLPQKWKLFQGEDARESCPGIDVLSLTSAVRTFLRGGIRISGNSYLRFAPPRIYLENGTGEEIVKMNGSELQRSKISTVFWDLPLNAPLGEPLRIEVYSKDQLLQKHVLRLEEAELPGSFDSIPCRDEIGEICSLDLKAFVRGAIVGGESEAEVPLYPRCLPFHLSDRIIFVGSCPGQISNWPAEEPPKEWTPVWTITKKSRKESEVGFCGLSEHLNGQLGKGINDRRKLREWKEILWHGRKTTKRPVLRKLNQIWEKYVQGSQNV